MKISLFVLLFLSACSQLSLVVDDKPRSDIKFISHRNYKEIIGAENVLRDVSGATIQVTFRIQEYAKEPQDLIGFSIGGPAKKTSFSRASLRIEPNGHLVGIARSVDDEDMQTVRSETPVALGKFQTAAAVIDYTQNSIKLYLDGTELPVRGKVAFKAPKTANTSSINAALGSEDDGSTFFFKGDLRNPKVWGRALTSEELKGSPKE